MNWAYVGLFVVGAVLGAATYAAVFTAQIVGWRKTLMYGITGDGKWLEK